MTRSNRVPKIDGSISLQIEGASFEQHRKLGTHQFQRWRIVEEISVEIRDRLAVEVPALGHRLEKLGDVAVNKPGVPVRLLEKLAKNMIGQEPYVFGEHAEDQAVQKVRHLC